MNIKSIVLVAFAMSVIQCSQKEETPLATLYVGTYTDTESEGIYKLQFDTANGKIVSNNLAAEITSPSFLAISKDKDFLYAVQETNDFEEGAGAVTTFSIENDSLKKLQTVSSKGAHPCHISISPTGNKVAVSNYTGGNASVYDVSADGILTGPSAIINHNQIDTTKTAHTHMAQWLNGKIYIADLGLDAVLGYEMNATGEATPSSVLELPEGAGPRHFTGAHSGKFLYVINELNSSISVFEKDATGKFKTIQNESTLAADFKGESFCADIHLSADGKFLYGSNRGENTIVIFSVDQQTGRLSLVDRESVHGNWPRNFTIDPTGKYLLVANQKSNNITVFKRDVEKGTLTFLHEEAVSKPVCLVFL